MKSLSSFRASAQPCADLGARFGALYFEKSPRAGVVYDGDCYIECEPDGSFYLTLQRDEYRAPTREPLENVLYLFAIIECPQSMDVSAAAAIAMARIEAVVGTQVLATIISMAGRLDDRLAPLEDLCDVNDCAIAAWRRTTPNSDADTADHDAVDAILDEVYALIEQRDDAR